MFQYCRFNSRMEEVTIIEAERNGNPDPEPYHTQSTSTFASRSTSRDFMKPKTCKSMVL